MTSLVTNTASMSALRLLSGTQKALGQVQGQVSTGLRVAQASDDAAFWSIATAMRARTAGLAAGQDDLSLEMGILQTAQSALGLVRQDVVGIGDDLVRALQPGVDKRVVEADVAARQTAIQREASGASFDGVNVLVDQFTFGGDDRDQWGNSPFDPGQGANAQFKYDVPTGTSDSALALNGFDLFATLGGYLFDPDVYGSLYLAPGTLDTRFDTTNSDDLEGNGFGVQRLSVLTCSVTAPPPAVNTLHTGDATDGDLRAAQAAVEGALKGLASVGARLGGQINLVSNLQAATSGLSDALTAGVGSLLDADMSVASTRLQALQAQQQLGVQALSIANANGATILKLFRYDGATATSGPPLGPLSPGHVHPVLSRQPVRPPRHPRAACRDGGRGDRASALTRTEDSRGA